MASHCNINYNTKHLKSGDPLPPFTGKVRVYNMRFCPYAQRTILALNAKGIDYEVVNVNLKDKPEWLTTKSTFGKVPAVEVQEGVSIYESLVTVEYLDEIFPQRPLLPNDQVKKAFDKIIVSSIGPMERIFIKKVHLSAGPITENDIIEYHNSLAFIQDQLKIRGTKFLYGNDPGYADYMIWPWFEKFLSFDDEEKFKIDPVRYGLLLEYLNNMLNDPAVSSYLVPKKVLLRFIEEFVSGVPNYDSMSEL